MEHERELQVPAALTGEPQEHGEEHQDPGDKVRPADPIAQAEYSLFPLVGFFGSSVGSSSVEVL